MTSPSGRRPTMDDVRKRPSTLVWIDSREAIIVRWLDGEVRLVRVESDVPAHHRATGHVRHDPTVRHGGGGISQTAGEPHRIEHLNRFVGQVAKRLQPGDDVLILGSGTVHERLERQLGQSGSHHGRHRRVACEASPRLTDRPSSPGSVRSPERRRGGAPSERTAGLVFRRTTHLTRAGLASRRVGDKPPSRKVGDGP